MTAGEPTAQHQRAGLALRLRRWLLRHRLLYARSRLGRLFIGASRFLYVPPHLHLADPSVAGDFLAGQVVLAGRSVLAGNRSIFDHAAPSQAYAIALNGFAWLRHFDASGDPKVRAGARALVAQWLARRERGALPEAEWPECVAARVMAFVTHSALLTETISYESYRRLVAHLNQDAAVLRLLAGLGDAGFVRVEAAIAFAFHALSLDRRDSAVREASTLLVDALADGFDADGAPRDRNAASSVEVAANLVPLLALYRARQIPAPEVLTPILMRVLGFIRMMQHPDGGLALFAGAGLATRDLVAQVTRFGAGRVLRLASAAEAGFERLEDEHAIVIADTGRLPPPAFARNAGASALAFEFSTKSDRIIVNCGMPASAEGETRRSFNAAAAHSTVLIDDHALANMLGRTNLFGREEFVADTPARPIPAVRRREGASERLILAHDGLRRLTGYRLERELGLIPEGRGLAGIDRAIADADPRENRRLTLAFHLHPRVLPVPLTRQDAVVLRVPHQSPGRDMWLFEAPGFPLHLEESRCYDQDLGLSKTEAIILDVPISGSTTVRWRLTPYTG